MSLATSGRDNLISCLFVVGLLALVAVVAWPVLGDATIPLWRRVAAGVAGPVVALLGALLVMVAVGGVIGGFLYLADRRRERRLARLVQLLTAETEASAAREGEVERLARWALGKQPGDMAMTRLAVEEEDALVAAARPAAPHRTVALRILLRYAGGWSEPGPVREAIGQGRHLLESEDLDDEERRRLAWWTRALE